jgi:hypothetical protein
MDRSTKKTSRKWALLLLGLGIAAASYIWLDTAPTAQVNSSNSNASAAVPVPRSVKFMAALAHEETLIEYDRSGGW